MEEVRVPVGAGDHPRDDLCPRVLQVLIRRQCVGPVEPVEVGHREDAVGGRLDYDLGDADEGVVAEQFAEGPDVGGLVSVVEFLGDPGGHFFGRTPHVGHVTRGGRLDEPKERHEQFGVREVVPDRLCHTGILNLDRHLTTVGHGRAVDLPDGCRRYRLVLELGEHLVHPSAEFRFQHLPRQSSVHGWGVGL